MRRAKTRAVDKTALKAALLERLEAELASARAAHQAAVDGATHSEARAENAKDTRGLEQSYLARGHAQRVGELEIAVAAITAWQPRAFASEPVTLGALVTVDEDGRSRTFLLAGHGGGLALSAHEPGRAGGAPANAGEPGRAGGAPANAGEPGSIIVLTPTSPVGRALLGRSLDDDCEVGKRTLRITAVE